MLRLNFNSHMKLFDPRRFINSFRYTSRGLKYIFLKEQNFRLQVFIGLGVIVLSFYFHLKLWEKTLLFLIIILVLTLEIINTIFERMVDVVAPQINSSSKHIKDMMGAAVLISAIGAAIVGILVFWPYLVK